MGTISLQIPVIGQPDTTEDVKVQNSLTTLQNVINGNLDATNVAPSLAQSATVNQSGQTVKGASVIATSESTGSLSPVTLTTPDQVSNVVLASPGLLTIWYLARVQESVLNQGFVSLWIGGNQAAVANPGQTGFLQVATGIGGSAINRQQYITTHAAGLGPTQANTGSQIVPVPVTTGQVMGTQATNSGTVLPGYGGPCYVFAAAGTYTVSVKYQVLASGTVTADNRRLYVKAESFA